MGYTYYFDDELGKNHIEKHHVTEAEINEFFTEKIKKIEIKRRDGSFVAFGRLQSGRYLQVIFRKPAPKDKHIITAFDLQDGEIISILDGIE